LGKLISFSIDRLDLEFRIAVGRGWQKIIFWVAEKTVGVETIW